MTTAAPTTTPKPKRRWLQFSLRTLMIVMAWSAVVVWMNTTPRAGREFHAEIAESSFQGELRWTEYGWPWHHSMCCVLFTNRQPFAPGMIDRYWALTGDAAVGVLLVTVLTCASECLLRRTEPDYRRSLAPDQPDRH